MTQRKNQKSEQRHAAIYSYIKEFLRENGYPPTVREIGAHVGLKSSSTVHIYLSQMMEKGLLRKDPSLPRGIGLVEKSPWKDTVNVPLVGTVTAGVPITAIQNAEENYSFSRSLIGTKDETFMLRVKGSSMIKIGICDGDYVIVKKQSTANDGQVIVALVNGEEATVKRFFHDTKRGCIRLQPENDSMEPFYETDVTILGLVIGVFRRM